MSGERVRIEVPRLPGAYGVVMRCRVLKDGREHVHEVFVEIPIPTHRLSANALEIECEIVSASGSVAR